MVSENNKVGKYLLDSNVLPEMWRSNWKDFECYKVYLSDICACLCIETDSIKIAGNLHEDWPSLIREQVLDLGDWLSSQGIRMPLVLVMFDEFFTDRQNYKKWRECAGNQEWLRGNFSIQLIRQKAELERRLEHLLDAAVEEILEIEQKNDIGLAKEVFSVIAGDRKMSAEQTILLEKIANEIQNLGITQRMNEWNAQLEKDYIDLMEGIR
jgi:hypothetical protein